MPRVPILVAVLFVTLRAGSPVLATEDYAVDTGQDCAVCHHDPTGGGALTALGEGYAATGYGWPVPAGSIANSRPAGVRWLRLCLGFLHLTTAVMWIGTIFYVHLVLRPQYAKGGLPRTEVRIAWGCILLLAVTGVPLTLMRFRQLGDLLATRSGNLLLVKIGLYLFLVVAAAVATLCIGPRLKRLRMTWQKNDGRQGRPAWVKLGEQLYDLTASPRWAEGNHFRRHQAGEDLTEALEGAPHGAEKLDGFPPLPADAGSAAGSPPVVRLFYTMAYVNLFVALGVLAVIAVWRWG